MPKHVCGVHLWPFGERCTATAIKTKRGAWRCPLHGGLSTGPKSAEGKARISAAVRKRWNAYRAANAAPPTSDGGPTWLNINGNQAEGARCDASGRAEHGHDARARASRQRWRTAGAGCTAGPHPVPRRVTGMPSSTAATRRRR